MKNNKSFDKCRNYAFRLLKFRMRSQEELRSRLKRKKFELQTIEDVIKFLEQKKFIDDKEFSRIWVETKLKRPLGIRRIRQELKIKGVESSIIEEALSIARGKIDEQSVVFELARQRLERLKGLEPCKQRSRLYSFLLRRGFSPDVVCDTINKL